MARFYASVEGSRNGIVTKTGTPNSGINGHIRGWKVGIRVRGRVDLTTGEDTFEVFLTSGSNGHKHEIKVAEFTEKDLDQTPFMGKVA